jgi:GNAT superfamily N-acetyltransferase
MSPVKPQRLHQARKLCVRRVKAADTAALIQLVAELSTQRADDLQKRASALTAAEVKRQFLGRSPKFLTLVAELDGVVVAYALLLAAYDSARATEGLNVADIYVNAEGRKKSVGRTLLAACAAEAKRQGKTYLTWLSKAWDVPAHDSYRRIGAIEEPVMTHLLPLTKVPAFVAEGQTMMPAKGLRKRRPART